MVAVTYDVARASAGKASAKASPKAAASEAAAPRKPWYVRLMAALIESRMQQAQREIARHIHLVPYTLDGRGNELVKVHRPDVPFGGW